MIFVFSKNAETIELFKLPSVRNYFENTNIMNKSTAEEYLNRLKIFSEFLHKEYDSITIDTLLEKIKDGIIDTYNILSQFSADQKKLQHFCNYNKTKGYNYKELF